MINRLALTIILMMATSLPTWGAWIWSVNGYGYKLQLTSQGANAKPNTEISQERNGASLGQEIWVGDPNYGPTVQTAINVIGSSNVILRVPAGTHNIATDLTVPANITLKSERGAVFAIPTGKTLTINSLEAGPYQIFSCRGTGKVVFGDGSVDLAYPEWWGAKGDGRTDCTAAIAAATNAVNGKVPVRFLSGSYLITDLLTLAVNSYAWEGPRSEKGNVLDNYATTITFAPADTTKFLVSRYSTTAPLSAALGPFIHRNLKFDLGAANGFEFGRESLGVGIDGTVQRYVSSVQFENCKIQATYANRASVNGVLTRSGRKMVWLTKAFECLFSNLTLAGGDTQVRTFGCDRPTFRDIRSLYSHLPFDFNGAGYFTAAPTIDNFQVEGWTFTPIRTYATGITATNLRIEQNDGIPTGGRRYDLTAALGIHANVAVAATTLTFSQDMTGILFPGLSIIELSDGTTDNTTPALVTSVNGATVAILSSTYIHWANATANVTRIHGYGPIHQPTGDIWDASYTNIHGGAQGGSPSYVYVPGRSAMSIANASQQAGSDNPGPSLIIGNVTGERNYLDQQMTFTNCSPLILPPLGHPLVQVSNWRQNYGSGYSDKFRSKSGDLFSDFAQVQRVWSFTPKSMNSAGGAVPIVAPIIKLAGDTNTEQSLYAWLLSASIPGDSVWCADRTLPTSGYVRIRVKAKAKITGGKADIYTFGNGFTQIASGVILSTAAWTVWEKVVACPAEWIGSRDSSYQGPGIAVAYNTQDIYLAGITIEELPEGQGLPVLTAAPANPYQGMMAIADRATWDPKAKGSGGPYPVWYNGTNWKLLNEQ